MAKAITKAQIDQLIICLRMKFKNRENIEDGSTKEENYFDHNQS